ncbi:hypothetical protein K3495_g1687 [Podosphaera aphanis]|nr:hypothetical protein K3495_g1687 [Podosphaera aphanis]
MSSGNHRDLTKAISKATSELSLPLPDQLLEIISIYLDKRNLDDELETQRLQDDLLTIYKTSVLPYPSRLAAFLTVLQKLRLALRDSIRQIKWWEQILAPIIVHLEVDPRSAVETRDILLCILTSDQDDDDGAQSEDFQTTSHATTEILLAKWLAKTKQADEDLDNNAAFVASQIELILFEYGKKNPKVEHRIVEEAEIDKTNTVRTS